MEAEVKRMELLKPRERPNNKSLRLQKHRKKKKHKTRQKKPFSLICFCIGSNPHEVWGIIANAASH